MVSTHTLSFKHPETAASVKIVMGWDRPLQRHFLMFNNGPKKYSNLDDKQDAGTLDYYKTKLESAGLLKFVPENMLAALANDKLVNLGNSDTKYDLNGLVIGQ